MYRKLRISSDRTRNIIRHVGISFLLKGGSVLANFLIVPVTMNYLDNENYGVWLTLSSFIAWFSFFDIGLGNGLRNKFAEARVRNDDDLARAYVSSAYFTVGIISLILVSVFFVINPMINWASVFNAPPGLQDQLKILMPVVFAFFGLQLVVRLITTIYIADQRHSIQGQIQFLTQVVSLLAIWILTQTKGSSLLLFGAVFSALPVIVLLFLNGFAFRKRYRNFKPGIKFFGRKYLKDIMGLGLNFFIIQIAVLVLFSTDNFIISKLFSPAEVVPYNVAYKYFSVATMIYTVMITPYWSAFTEAYTRKDVQWIKNSVKNIQKLWLAVPGGLLIMILASSWFYNLWVGDKVSVPTDLSVAMAVFVMLLTFNMIYVNFINGVGKIKLQLMTSIFVMIVNIPLSMLFAVTFHLGSTGVILASCFCLISSVILFPVQYKKIISGQAKGIWGA